MIPIKIECGCGQRYAFDTEPLDGRVSHEVRCPQCGIDGTAAADDFLAQHLAAMTVPMAAPRTGMRLQKTAPSQSLAPSAEAVANLHQMERGQVDHEARAKILWGDEAESVIKFMLMHRVPHDEACAIVAGFVRERTAVTRANGIRKILLGVPLMCVPVVAFFIFSNAGYFPLKLFGFAVVIGIFGGWIVLKGVLLIAVPKMEPGDVAEQ